MMGHMFGRSKSRSTPPPAPTPPPAKPPTAPQAPAPSPLPFAIRDTLFGDSPLEAWPPLNSPVSVAPVSEAAEPWKSFILAREAIGVGAGDGQNDRAIALWQSITAMPDLESRHYAQAWHFLRAHDVQPPPALAKRLLAVVFEVPSGGGLDLLAAYPERTARYYNFSGDAIIWERPSDALDTPIDAVLAAAQPVLNAIGPWEQPRPAAPQGEGHVRINMVSPAGLHFGQGAFATLMAEVFARPLIEAGIALMQRMMEVDGRDR